MKSVYKIFAVILAAGLTAMSCDKKPINEDIPVVNPEGGDNGSEQDAGTRIITLSFDTKATRTDLGPDYKPKFSNGDMIAISSISSPTDTQHCKVTVNSTTGIATTVTKFDGECKAVYPAKYAIIIDGELTFIVPSEQTGKFEDANICTADIPEGKNPVAEFKNQTAIFEIKLPDTNNNWAQIMTLSVKSLGRIDDATGNRGSTKARITNDTASPYEITLSEMIYIDEEGDECHKFYENPIYISVLCDTDANGGAVQLVDLNFDINYYRNFDLDGDSCHTVWAQGGFSPYFLTTKSIPSDATVSKNSFYSGVENVLHEYFNAGNVKWAKDYLGLAGNDTSEIGYYAWGETTGHKWNGSTFEYTDGTSGYSFSTDNRPFDGDLTTAYTVNDFLNNKICFSMTNPEKPSETLYILTLEHDAAYMNWGGAWRMQRVYDDDDFQVEVYSLTTDGSFAVFYRKDEDEESRISFPDVGYANGTTRTMSPTKPYFWSSCLLSRTTTMAYVTYVKIQTPFLKFSNTNTTTGNRSWGHAIRPVSGTEID